MSQFANVGLFMKNSNSSEKALKDFFTHQRVCKNENGTEEIFDIYQLGLFLAPDSFLSSYINESIKNNESTHEILELVELQPNAEYKLHFHKKSAAIIYIISGTGIFLLGSHAIDYHPGRRVIIPAGILHGFKTDTRTLFLSIQSPPIIDPQTQQIDLHYQEDIA